MNETNARVSTITHKEQLSHGLCKITFNTDECKFTCPGQYAMLNVDGEFKPFQVCDYDSNRFTVVADQDFSTGMTLSEKSPGDTIDTTTGMGNGFKLDEIPSGTWIVADSKGIPEMLELARSLLTRGKSFRTVLGYSTKEEVYMVDAFRTICNELEILTLDGSNGREGCAADAVRNAEYVCASGSPEMMKKLAGKTKGGQFSFSNAMPCIDSEAGDYIIHTNTGDEVTVTDGPVFEKDRIDWDKI